MKPARRIRKHGQNISGICILEHKIKHTIKTGSHLTTTKACRKISGNSPRIHNPRKRQTPVYLSAAKSEEITGCEKEKVIAEEERNKSYLAAQNKSQLLRGSVETKHATNVGRTEFLY